MTDPALRRAVRKRFVQVGLSVLLQAVTLFWGYGSLRWVAAWVYLGVGLCLVLAIAVLVLPKNPELIAERGRLKPGTKKWDIVLAALVGMIVPLVMLLVASLDRRLGWSPEMPFAFRATSTLLYAVGLALFVWAMSANRYFSGVVRIQKERGHTAESRGPYRFVRHPGYVGMSLYTLATPGVLGSTWAFIPAAVELALLIIRTALEDRTLQAELEGYLDYSKQTRYRLLPGVW